MSATGNPPVRSRIGWWVSTQPVWTLAGRGETLYKAQLLGGAIAGSVVFYLLVMWLLRSEELKFMWGIVRGKQQTGNS